MTLITERIHLNRDVDPVSGFIVPHLVRPIEIFQGYHGPWSHFASKTTFKGKSKDYYLTNDDGYSVDFRVPFGTQVIASRAGKIELVTKSRRFYEGLDFQEGIKVLSSFLVINHGEFNSLYSHLGEVDRGIARGVEVEQGQPIAVTGKSGWIGPTPHLHFEVYKEVDHGRLSYPVKFEDYRGKLEDSDIFRTESR